MIVWTKRNAARAFTDRKGVTALEYAVIAAAIVPFAIAGFRAIGLRVAALVASVNF